MSCTQTASRRSLSQLSLRLNCLLGRCSYSLWISGKEWKLWFKAVLLLNRLFQPKPYAEKDLVKLRPQNGGKRQKQGYCYVVQFFPWTSRRWDASPPNLKIFYETFVFLNLACFNALNYSFPESHWFPNVTNVAPHNTFFFACYESRIKDTTIQLNHTKPQGSQFRFVNMLKC